MLLKPKEHDEELSKTFTESALMELHTKLCEHFLDKNVVLDESLFLIIKDIVEVCIF